MYKALNYPFAAHLFSLKSYQRPFSFDSQTVHKRQPLHFSVLMSPDLCSSTLSYTRPTPHTFSQFSRSAVSDSVIPWTATHEASLSITNSRSLLKLTSFELVMPSNLLILCRPLLLPPSIFPSIRVFSNESVLHMR